MLRLRNSTLLSLVFAPIGWMIILSVGLPVVWGLGRTMDLWPLEAYPQEARLIETILGSWFTFALPLACFSAGRRSLSHLHPRYWWGWTRERYYGLPAWVALGAIFLIYLGLMAVLASGSEWLIEQLPASWGISSEDLPAQSIEELIVRSPVGYVLMFLSFAVTPAIVEEVFFRGYYQRLLYSWTGGASLVANHRHGIRLLGHPPLCRGVCRPFFLGHHPRLGVPAHRRAPHACHPHAPVGQYHSPSVPVARVALGRDT